MNPEGAFDPVDGIDTFDYVHRNILSLKITQSSDDFQGNKHREVDGACYERQQETKQHENNVGVR
jgi:hypothetical protein